MLFIFYLNILCQIEPKNAAVQEIRHNAVKMQVSINDSKPQ